MDEIFFNRGGVAFNLLGGFVVALVVGLVLLGRYRRAVARLMRESSGPAPADGVRRQAPAAPLELELEPVPTAVGTLSLPSGPPRRTALIELVAGLAFGLLAALLILGFGGLEILPLRLAAVTVTLAWPSVLVISLLWGPDRRRQLVTFGAYLSVVVVLSLLSGLTAGDAAGLLAPITLWIIFASPGLVLLLFLNRAVRAVGPVLVVIAVAALVGANLALSLLATEAGATVAVELALAMGGGAATAFWVTAARGLGLGCAVGWGAAVALAEAHSAKRFGEQTLVTDAIWLLQTLVLANSLVIQIGAPGLIAAMLPLSIYKTITVVAHRRMARSLAGQAGRPLLFLRVFGFERRTVRLADLLAARWRYFGQVRLIACPDLAGRIVTPGNFLTFMRGRLGELFIRDHAGLDRRLAALDGARDPDARFRVENLFCSGDAWLEAVRRLMRDASAVVMDLRSFGADNEGCAFELQALLDSVPLPRIFLLVDGTTDLDLLRATLGQQWQRLDAASSNQRATRPRLHLLDVAGSEVAAVERLLREVVGEVAEPAVPNPQVATT